MYVYVCVYVCACVLYVHTITERHFVQRRHDDVANQAMRYVLRGVHASHLLANDLWQKLQVA